MFNLYCWGRTVTNSLDRWDKGRKRDASPQMFSLSSQSRSKRGSMLVLVRKKALNASETKLNKRPFLRFSVCWNKLYSEGFPSTPLWVSTAGFIEAECVHMNPVERRGSQGSPQVTGRHCRRMWLCSLTRVCWCGPTHPICQCNYSSSLAGVSYMQQWSYEGVVVGCFLREESGVMANEELRCGSFSSFCFHSHWGRKCYLG